jgi:hypothetical protein
VARGLPPRVVISRRSEWGEGGDGGGGAHRSGMDMDLNLKRGGESRVQASCVFTFFRLNCGHLTYYFPCYSLQKIFERKHIRF